MVSLYHQGFRLIIFYILYTFLILHFDRKDVYFDLLLCIFITILHYLFRIINKFIRYIAIN